MGRQTNTARRQAMAATAQEKARAARAAAVKRERRRRVAIVAGATVVVLAVIAVIVVVGATSSSKKPAAGGRSDAPAGVVAAVSTVPAATLTRIGAGAITTPPKGVSDAALSSAGKPEVLFIGAEFCPYCAAERWPLVQALSRFGTFSGLKVVRSSPTDAYPNTATFSFHGSGYTSDMLSFTARELETVAGTALEKPTAAENALWKKYTGQGSFPFLDIDGKYVITGPSYDPAVLKGLSANAIAEQLADPNSKVAQAVDGTANVITAALCRTTDGAPAAVCSAAGVKAAAKSLSD